MKYKILSAVIATTLLSACGGTSSSSSDAHSVKAYDPAVANMNVKYDCTNSSGTASATTDANGIARVTAFAPAYEPETCKFTLVGRSNSVDMSNGKDMSGVTYIIPKGMAQAGQLVTASPLSTLLATTLGDAEYSDSAATQLLMDLGLDSLLTSGVTISEVMLDPEAAAEKLPAAEKSKLLATTAVVSDVVTNAAPGTSAKELTDASAAIAKTTLDKYPKYPSNGSKDIYLVIDADTVAKAVDDPTADVTLPPEKEAEPVDPEDVPTGGTGGTGGGSDGGTGG